MNSKWYHNLERKLGRNFGIPHLLFVLSACQLIVFFFSYAFEAQGINLISLLAFNRDLIFQGQVWRLLSYILIPQGSSPFFMVLWLYSNCLIGHYLEMEWNVFGINLFYFTGVLFTTVGGLISGSAYFVYLTASLFLAFAAIFPNIQFLLFFIIPVKAKYLAYVTAFFYIIELIRLFTALEWAELLSLVLSLGNLILFFGGDYYTRTKNYFRHRKQRQNFRDNTHRF